MCDSCNFFALFWNEADVKARARIPETLLISDGRILGSLFSARNERVLRRKQARLTVSSVKKRFLALDNADHRVCVKRKDGYKPVVLNAQEFLSLSEILLACERTGVPKGGISFCLQSYVEPIDDLRYVVKITREEKSREQSLIVHASYFHDWYTERSTHLGDSLPEEVDIDVPVRFRNEILSNMEEVAGYVRIVHRKELLDYTAEFVRDEFGKMCLLSISDVKFGPCVSSSRMSTEDSMKNRRRIRSATPRSGRRSATRPQVMSALARSRGIKREKIGTKRSPDDLGGFIKEMDDSDDTVVKEIERHIDEQKFRKVKTSTSRKRPQSMWAREGVPAIEIANLQRSSRSKGSERRIKSARSRPSTASEIIQARRRSSKMSIQHSPRKGTKPRDDIKPIDTDGDALVSALSSKITGLREQLDNVGVDSNKSAYDGVVDRISVTIQELAVLLDTLQNEAEYLRKRRMEISKQEKNNEDSLNNIMERENDIIAGLRSCGVSVDDYSEKKSLSEVISSAFAKARRSVTRKQRGREVGRRGTRVDAEEKSRSETVEVETKETKASGKVVKESEDVVIPKDKSPDTKKEDVSKEEEEKKITESAPTVEEEACTTVENDVLPREESVVEETSVADEREVVDEDSAPVQPDVCPEEKVSSPPVVTETGDQDGVIVEKTIEEEELPTEKEEIPEEKVEEEIVEGEEAEKESELEVSEEESENVTVGEEKVEDNVESERVEQLHESGDIVDFSAESIRSVEEEEDSMMKEYDQLLDESFGESKILQTMRHDLSPKRSPRITMPLASRTAEETLREQYKEMSLNRDALDRWERVLRDRVGAFQMQTPNF